MDNEENWNQQVDPKCESALFTYRLSEAREIDIQNVTEWIL